MMHDVRLGKDHLTNWIRPNILRELESYFRDNDGFKHLLLTNVANRALLRSSSYTGGSVTFIKTKTRLSKSLDREAKLAETFKYTHTLKENKKRFAYERSAAHYEEYQQSLETATQQSQPLGGANKAGSDTSIVDPDRI
ncbi:hypothetical protein Ahy_B04g069569 [Arachis hypogaea]|uniref:Uncharacterized protein n=1 Tax=Arachis hypogaea TaxID=3818 RepID=A0A444ZCZ7_ARAHY|nr:hypothetical protein Ahy_B04g069569 [Arachis hypogaea]